MFLPGEREIRETGELAARARLRAGRTRDAVEILPLYSRLSVQEQQRIFAPSRGRRIVLATNVAETSLTVPGIRYVIDTGLARIKRYNAAQQDDAACASRRSRRRRRSSARAAAVACRTASACASTRKRTSQARPAYTEPEILRSSLASVILRMAALDLGARRRVSVRRAADAARDRRRLSSCLPELGRDGRGAHADAGGRELARLPLDPRIGRIVLAARERGCLAEALVIASALAVPDPRERPLDKQAAADQAHLRFRDERSDFLSLVALWEFFDELSAQKLSHRKLVDACRAQFVNFLRLDRMARRASAARERARRGGLEMGSVAAGSRSTTRATRRCTRRCSRGCVANVGAKSEDGDGFLGTRGLRFYIHPGSGLAKKPPKWVLAAELVETDAAVRALRRAHRAGMDRGGRGRSGHARVLRRALGRDARRGRRKRARAAATG